MGLASLRSLLVGQTVKVFCVAEEQNEDLLIPNPTLVLIVFK
jgi:hypothetical protein